MTALTAPQTNGFPEGYFVIKSTANGRVLDVAGDLVEDGTEVILWPETESSLVETRRSPNANNQVFFIDTSGALCSRSSGHAIDIEDDRLVLRHRRPISTPFPNSYSHPLPEFSYSSTTGEITVTPSYPSNAFQGKSYVLSAIPLRKPRTIIDDATQFLNSAITAPFSLLSGGSSSTATPEQVSEIDLREDEIVDEDRGQEGEIDDSPEQERKVRVLTVSNKTIDWDINEATMRRRRWTVAALRTADARTGV